jgi:hypothetical protein
MVRYAFDARSSKILLTCACCDGDAYVDINNILAMVDKGDEGTLIVLATGGENMVVSVKEKVKEIVDFIQKLADEQMARREEEAKAREEEFKKAREAQEAAKQ